MGRPSSAGQKPLRTRQGAPSARCLNGSGETFSPGMDGAQLGAGRDQTWWLGEGERRVGAGPVLGMTRARRKEEGGRSLRRPCIHEVPGKKQAGGSLAMLTGKPPQCPGSPVAGLARLGRNGVSHCGAAALQQK